MVRPVFCEAAKTVEGKQIKKGDEKGRTVGKVGDGLHDKRLQGESQGCQQRQSRRWTGHQRRQFPGHKKQEDADADMNQDVDQVITKDIQPAYFVVDGKR